MKRLSRRPYLYSLLAVAESVDHRQVAGANGKDKSVYEVPSVKDPGKRQGKLRRLAYKWYSGNIRVAENLVYLQYLSTYLTLFPTLLGTLYPFLPLGLLFLHYLKLTFF